jgi:hypothetical protein
MNVIAKIGSFIEANRKPIVYVGAAVLIVILVYRMFFQGDGSGSSLKNCKDLKPSKPVPFFDSLADQIADMMVTGPFGMAENDSGIASALMQCACDDDVQQLICSFGERKLWNLIGTYPLPGAVAQVLDQGDKEEVNTNYASKGITYRWA